MTKKILFLLTFLLTTLGGGNLALAVDTKTFTSANAPTCGNTETIGNIIVTYGNSNSGYTGGTFTYEETVYYGLKANKTESNDLDGNIPKSDSDNFYLKFTTYYEGTMSVNFYNDDKKGNSRGLRCYKKSTSGTVSKVGEYSVSDQTMGTLTFDMEPGYTYYVYDTNTGAIYYTGFSFTPVTKTNSVKYSHTWNFNYGENNYWPNTVGAMLTANSTWTTGGFGGRYQYTGTVNTSGGDALYDGNGNLVEETRGLKFSATNASDIQTDLHYDLMLKNGASVIIPSAKIGQTVSIWGWWPSGKTISVANAKTSENANSVTGTGAIAEFVFAVTANADVTITVSDGDDNFFFYSISINKSELTTFAHNINGNETFYGLSTPSSGKIGGAFIGKTTTFQYKVGRDQVLRTRVDIAPGLDVTGITVNSTNFTLKSDNNNNILDPTSCYVSSYNATTYHKFNYGSIKVKKPGTASLTYSFNGTDAYNAKNYTEQFTIQKDDIDLTFASDFVEKTVGDPAFTNSFKLNGLTLPVTDDYAGTINTSSFTYEVKTVNDKQTSNIVSVSNTGEVTLSSPGAVLIHAKLASTDWYNGVDRKYTLVVNPSGGTSPVLQWSDDLSSVSVPYNNAVSHTATGTIGVGQTIKYRSADTSVASVDATGKVTGTGRGSTTIYAYVEPTNTHNYAEISCSVTVTSAGELESFRFIPNNGKVNNGKSITPKLAFPTIPGDGVTSLKVTKIQVLERNGISVSEPALTADDAIAACDIIRVDASNDLRNNWELDGVNKVFKVNVTINGKKVGKARITVTFESEYYNTATATYDVEVTEAGTTNFSWTEGSGSPEYYTYAGDFMMLPALTGNSNGNYNYSSGAKNSSSYTEGGDSHSALHAYEYERKWGGSNFNITWNNKNIKIGEGFPDFAIVTEGISSPGTASVFFGRGEGSSHPDTLMVYCETAGDVKLRAYDPQDHNKYCDATIHILPISNIEGTDGSATTVKNGMTYPYTWDFTTDFNMDEMVGTTDQYWIPMKNNNGEATGDYTNGYGFFNLDWADTNKNPDKVDRFYKYFIAGARNSKTGYMHQFNGMMLQMKGSTSWANKMDRMRIYAYDSDNKKGRLGFIGGYHTMKLFLPEVGKRPSDFKIFVKASGTGSVCIMGTDEKAVSSTVKTLSSDAAIYSFDISDVTYTSNGYILMGFEDARVYWIAMSTEAKNLSYFKHSNSHLTYAAAAYSYPEDLDLSKSNEVNGATAYYASSYIPDKDAQGAYTNEQEQQYAVVMKPLTNLGTYVPKGTGMLLKYDDLSSIDVSENDATIPFYMIANPRNVKTYSAAETITGDVNYLVGTGANAQQINGRGTDYTNFMMSAAYKYYTDITNANTAQGGYRFDRDWSFYPVMKPGEVEAQKSYLHIPANLYVDKNGKIVNMPSSSRRTAGESAEAPASKAALAIVFDDDLSNGQGTTGISTVATETTVDSDAWYTLQGVRVETPTKGGIYIHKGRKIVVK